KIEYDSEIIDYYALVDIFFNTHDSTTLNRQGNDIGTQYRSAVFYINDQEKKIVLDYIDDFQKSIKFIDKVFTEVKKLDIFYEAEDYHKNYYNMNKNTSYCSFIITPKVTKFMERYKEMLKKIT
ncbi:MAG: peptide-methionine (S)-S-oxide reductase, partial [Bacteroidota bacterium]|nr:peptide-methionine (S)-S-oxide reductase [Bacteroidota bacterium]